MEKEPFFPSEVTGGAFKVTLTGRGRAWVEQHQGLLGYTAEEALFRTKEGTLRISGANLRFLQRCGGFRLRKRRELLLV